GAVGVDDPECAAGLKCDLLPIRRPPRRDDVGGHSRKFCKIVAGSVRRPEFVGIRTLRKNEFSRLRRRGKSRCRRPNETVRTEVINVGADYLIVPVYRIGGGKGAARNVKLRKRAACFYERVKAI